LTKTVSQTISLRHSSSCLLSLNTIRIYRNFEELCDYGVANSHLAFPNCPPIDHYIIDRDVWIKKFILTLWRETSHIISIYFINLLGCQMTY